MKLLLTILAYLVCFSPCFSQQETSKAPAKPAPKTPKYILDGLDPIGRYYYPTVGVLPAISSTNVPEHIVRNISIAFANGLKLNAHLPFGAVSKEKFDSVKDIVSGLSKEELKQYYYFESIGVEYLMRLDVNRYKMVIEKDTFWAEANNPKSAITKINPVYHVFATLSATIIDVGTSNLVLAHSFNVKANTRVPNTATNNAPPAPIDSTVALSKMYEQIKNVGQTYSTTLSGVGSIDSLLQIKKDRAKEVRVNANKMMNFSPTGTTFNVYQLGEDFVVDGLHYQHAEEIGQLYKNGDYKYWEMNFEVTRGEREIFEAFNAGKKLVCAIGLLPLSTKSPGSNLPAIMVDTFQSKGKGAPDLVRMFQDRTVDVLSRRTQLFNLVNRNSFKDIEIERAIQSKTKSDATQAGITTGAEYLLTAEMLNYFFGQELQTKTIEEPVPQTAATTTKPAAVPAKPTVKPAESTPNPDNKKGKTNGSTPAITTTPTPAKTTPAAPKPAVKTKVVAAGTKAYAIAKIEARMISVKTGEILWSKVLEASATTNFPPIIKGTDKNIQQEQVNVTLVDDFARDNVNALFLNLIRPLPILKVLETSKKEIDVVLVGGGTHAGLNSRMALEVIEASTEMVDNQALKRETVVAELRLDDLYPETASWKVRKGGEELKARMDANAKLYCRVRGL
jgi:hypothetical protein